MFDELLSELKKIYPDKQFTISEIHSPVTIKPTTHILETKPINSHDETVCILENIYTLGFRLTDDIQNIWGYEQEKSVSFRIEINPKN